MPFWDDDGSTNAGWAANVKTAQSDPAAVGIPQATQNTSRGSDNFDPDKETNAAYWAQHAKDQAAYTANHAMSRDDFLKKYGTTFKADDKGGNAASEVAGGDVGAYYDKYLAPGAKNTQTVSHGWDSDPTEERIQWGEGKYQDAHPLFDGYDNVNPHPISQKGNGFEEAWRQVGRPIAYGALMYAGVGALGGMMGAGAAVGAGEAAGAGIGTSAAADFGAGTYAAGQGTASGLAGSLGMNAGYGATALNSGALNTGMSLARGNNIGDALKSGVTSAFLSPISTYVGDAAGGGIIGKLAGNSALGAAQGAVSGKGVGAGLRDGFVNGLADVAGSYVGGKVSGIINGGSGESVLGNLGGSVASSVIKGKSPLEALISGGANAAAGQITGSIDGFSELSPDQQSFITSMVSSSLKGKSPTKSLIDGVTQMATGQVSKSKSKTNTTTGGWSA